MRSVDSAERPFYNGDSGLPPEMFGCREDVLERIQGLLGSQAGSPRLSMHAVVGRKNYGKSSLATKCVSLAAALEPHAICVHIKYLDVRSEGKAQDVRNHFLRTLYASILSSCFTMLERHSAHPKIGRLHPSLWGFDIRWLWTHVTSWETKVNLPWLEIRRASVGLSRYERFLERVATLVRSTRLPVKVVLILVDEIQARGEAAPLFHEFATALRNVEKWADDSPTIGVVILPFPWWDKDLDMSEADRVLRKNTMELKAFSQIETSTFVRDRCQKTGWTFEEGFQDLLYRVTGGIPPLVQKVGWECCLKAERRPDAVRRLMICDIHDVVGEDPVQSLALSVMNEAHELSLHDMLQLGCDPVMIASFADGDKVSLDDAVRGVDESTWRRRVCGSIKRNDVFQKIWTVLSDKGIIERVPATDHFRFCAELIRQQLVRARGR